jgi:hypothetical protein
MNTRDSLRTKAKMVGAGDTPIQAQNSLTDQLADLATLANMFGFYDAADHITKTLYEGRR